MPGIAVGTREQYLSINFHGLEWGVVLFTARETYGWGVLPSVLPEQARKRRYCTYSAIDLEAHAELWATLAKPHCEPYFWPFHNTIMATCFELWDRGWRERFEIIFDEQVIFGPRAKAWYPAIRETVAMQNPEEG